MIIQTMVNLALDDPTCAALVGDRVYPRQMPDAPTFPLAVITKVYGRGETDQAGAVELEEARVQIDLYTDQGYAALVVLRRAFRELFHGRAHGRGSSPPNSCAIQRATCMNDVDMTEPTQERAGPRLRRRMLEFRVWNTEE